MLSSFDTKETPRLITIFHDLFFAEYQTVLAHATGDPMYLPKDAATPYHRLLFAHGFFQSALHEVAHWCIAGPKRRELIDFGYWYKPHGRTKLEQEAFFSAETKPQALEWIFTAATAREFFLSSDNLDEPATESTKRRIQLEAFRLIEAGLPKRARCFADALVESYSSREAFDAYWVDAKSRDRLPH